MKTVGTLKFGGELVARQLVHLDKLLEWLVDTVYREHAADDAGGEDADKENLEKSANEQSLEAVCAVLTALSDRIDDFTTPAQAGIVDDIFETIEQLASNSSVSKRMNCLLNDLIDLRAGTAKLKDDRPQILVKREKKKDVVPSWCEPALWWQFKAVDHTLEVVDSRDEKLKSMRKVIQAHMAKPNEKMVVICAQANLRLCKNAQESFRESLGYEFGVLEYSMTDSDRQATIRNFENGSTRLLFLTADICTRRGFNVKAPSLVLNFDYPASAQLYLFRVYTRTAWYDDAPIRGGATPVSGGSASDWEPVKVHTFFEAGFDVKHASALQFLLEAAEYDVPKRLVEIAEVNMASQMSYEQAFGADPRENRKGDKRNAGGGRLERLNSNPSNKKSRAKGSRSPTVSEATPRNNDDSHWGKLRHTSPDSGPPSKRVEPKDGRRQHSPEDKWSHEGGKSTDSGKLSPDWRPETGGKPWRDAPWRDQASWRPDSASTAASARDTGELSTTHQAFLERFSGEGSTGLSSPARRYLEQKGQSC
jgi:hypothetical protein